MTDITYEIIMKAREAIAQNQECFVAQWILQNPDKRIEDYELVTQDDWGKGVHRFSVERKEVPMSKLEFDERWDAALDSAN